MPGMRISLSLALLMFGMVFATDGQAAANAPDPQILSKCESCHGLHGASTSATVPRLNGQQANYIKLRLKQFLNPARSTPHATYQMWETASNLGDRTADQLAQYFAAQAPTAAVPKGGLAASGEKIYRQGIGSAVPACQSCHGDSGEGRGAAPRLAGQHGEYLEQQMGAFMLQLRVSPDMNRHAWHMEPDQFKALAAYLSGPQ